MENENKTLPTNNPVDGNQPVNNQPTPIQPTPVQPVANPTVSTEVKNEPAKIETPVAEPAFEPIKIGKPMPISVPPATPEKAQKEEDWLHKVQDKEKETKDSPAKEKKEEKKFDTKKFKEVLARLKAKRVELKTKYPRGYKLAIVVIVVAILAAAWFFTFYEGDYPITREIKCNPHTEKCFIRQCDPESADEDKCTGDPAKDTTYYKLQERMASKVPYCDPANPECEAYTCEEGEKNCGEVLCIDGNADGIDCVDPKTFAEENPVKVKAQTPCTGANCQITAAPATNSVNSADLEDENFPDEIIPNEADTPEDLQAEQDALQNAENSVKSGN